MKSGTVLGRGKSSITVDHVSIAVPSIDTALAFWRRHFPIRMNVEKTIGYTPDFNWCDFYIGNFKLELIEPLGDGGFVERFLARRGPGMHHWSLDVTDLRPLIERMEHDGVRIVDKFEAPGGEMTAFISPRSAFGVLVQFWQTGYHPEHPADAVATCTLRNGETVRMRVDHVSIAVRDIPTALRFFESYFPYELRREPHVGWDGSFEIASFWVNGYKVELIQNRPGREGFVSKFIEKRGEGLHHISIDVDRLAPFADQLEADGVRVVDRQKLARGYETAFLSPRSTGGVLLQLWQSPEFH